MQFFERILLVDVFSLIVLENELASDFTLFLLADVHLLPAVAGCDISQSGKNYLGCVVFRLVNY